MNTINDLATSIQASFLSGTKLKNMSKILLEYNGNDWEQYKKFCEKGYTRNLAFRNELFEILIICWNKNQESCIHDHPENGCIVKILKGSLIEECYTQNNDEMKMISTNELKIGSTSYQEGKDGLHKIINPNPNECAVTIHVYSPPNYSPNFFY